MTQLYIRHVTDRGGVVHRQIFYGESKGPALSAARCGKPLVALDWNPCPTTANVSCVLCLADTWEPT